MSSSDTPAQACGAGRARDPDLRAYLRAGDTVAWGQFGAQPLRLTRALMAQRADIGQLRVFLGIGAADHPSPADANGLDLVSYAGGGTNRALSRSGVLDIWPGHYSQLPHALASGLLKVDVLLLQVSPPDEQGRYSLGLAHEYLLGALRAARVVIAEVHPDVPWTYGERTLQRGDFDLLVEADSPLPDVAQTPVGAVEEAIGRHVAGLVGDGAVLQTGIGAVPDALLAALHAHRDLGVHSGAIGDGVARLTEAGVITNARKSIDAGVTIAGVLMGGRGLRRFAHRNPALQMRGSDYTHGAQVLARIDSFVALNSAIEVDLTGQVNTEVAGGVYVGAVGGVLDFTRAAHASRDGMPIFALPSTAREKSRVVVRLSGPATVPCGDAGVVVTEYGVADLRGRPLRERARRLIAIAHPDFREALERDLQAAVKEAR